MGSKNTRSLEEKMSSTMKLEYLGLYVGKCWIPYIGDKAFHKLCNKNRERVDKKELLGFSKLSITAGEVLFYTAKYTFFGNLAYQIGKNIF